MNLPFYASSVTVCVSVCVFNVHAGGEGTGSSADHDPQGQPFTQQI